MQPSPSAVDTNLSILGFWWDVLSCRSASQSRSTSVLQVSLAWPSMKESCLERKSWPPSWNTKWISKIKVVEVRVIYSLISRDCFAVLFDAICSPAQCAFGFESVRLTESIPRVPSIRMEQQVFLFLSLILRSDIPGNDRSQEWDRLLHHCDCSWHVPEIGWGEYCPAYNTNLNWSFSRSWLPLISKLSELNAVAVRTRFPFTQVKNFNGSIYSRR